MTAGIQFGAPTHHPAMAEDERAALVAAEREAEREALFTRRHCRDWCESVGIDLAYVPAMVAELADDGPDSTLSWPTIARAVNARYEDGMEYR